MTVGFLEQMHISRKTGDVFTWYRELCSLADRWHFQFTDEQNEKIKQLMNSCKNLLNQPNAGQVKLNISIIEDKLSELDRTITQFMNTHQRIFYQPEYKSWQERIKEQFD